MGTQSTVEQIRWVSDNYSPALKKCGYAESNLSFCGSVVLWFCHNFSDENTLGTLWAQLLLQYSMKCFESLQLFSAWNEDRCTCGLDIILYFFSLFLLCELMSFFFFFFFLNMKCYQSI